MKKLIIATLLLIGTLGLNSTKASALTYCATGWQGYMALDAFMTVRYFGQCGKSAPIQIGFLTYLSIKID
jgi:hypothetical protein